VTLRLCLGTLDFLLGVAVRCPLASCLFALPVNAAIPIPRSALLFSNRNYVFRKSFYSIERGRRLENKLDPTL
jgi:hypothetical protein